MAQSANQECERIKTCPKNTVYDAKRNKCLPRQPEQPRCDDGQVLDKNGRCVPVRIVPRGCDDGFYLDRKSGRCLPVKRPQPEPQPIDPQPIDPGRVIIEKVPGILLQPGVVEKLIPRGQNKDVNTQGGDGCADGTAKDKNGALHASSMILRVGRTGNPIPFRFV